MQNEDYKNWLLYGCGVMEESIYYLFCAGMDICFAGEMKDIILPGETVELPGHILLHMERAVAQHIGQTVNNGIALLNSIKNINNFGSYERDDLLTDSTTNAGTENITAIPSKATPAAAQLTALITYIDATITKLKLAVWQLGAHHHWYAKVDIAALTGEAVNYFDGPDANIGLLAAFIENLRLLKKALEEA